jgi:MFS family permease
MISMCNSFWETMLAQGIGCGIGVGLLFLPAISILSQYFFRRRALAIGIAVTGSSIGGICLPIMLNNLIQSHGFDKAVQYLQALWVEEPTRARRDLPKESTLDSGKA